MENQHKDGNQNIPADEGGFYLYKERKKELNQTKAYCLELLNKTGVVLVPGSGKKERKKERKNNNGKGFGQKANEFHFRTTILPSISELPHILQSIIDFHKDFIKRNEQF